MAFKLPPNMAIANYALQDYQNKVSGYQCQAWVRHLYSKTSVKTSDYIGGNAWQAFKRNAEFGNAWKYTKGTKPPAGACVWWKPKTQGGYYGGCYGHVGIYIDGFVYHANFGSNIIKKTALSDMHTPDGWGWCCDTGKYNLKTGTVGYFDYSVSGGTTISDINYGDIIDSALGDGTDVQQVEPNYSLEKVQRYEVNVEGRQVFKPVPEDYHLIINGYDVVDYASDIELSEDIDELSTSFSFKLPFEPKDDHIYGQFKQKINPAVGDWVYWYNYGNTQRDTELFRGIITNITNDWNITCNDVGWYLNKTEIFYQANEINSIEAIKNMLKVAFPQGSGLTIEPGLITDKLTSIINKTWIGETPAEILNYILGQNQEEKGVDFLYKVRKNKLNVMPYPTKLSQAYVKQIGGGEGRKVDYGYFDCTWLLEGVSGSDNIDDLKNKVLAVAKDSSTGNSLVEVKDNTSIKKFARLQKVIELTENNVEEGTAFAQSTLKKLDVIKKERTVSNMLGHDCIISGLIMEFSSDRYGLRGYWLVKRVVQKYQPYHSMSLDLINVIKPSELPSLQTTVNEENFAEIQQNEGMSEITDGGAGFVNVDTNGWATTQASGYSPDDAGNKCADGTPFNWSTNCVAVGMKSGDWQKYKGKHIYISYGGKTVESVVRDVGNFGAGGKYSNRTLDLGPAVWKALGGLSDHQVSQWGVRTVKYKYKD